MRRIVLFAAMLAVAGAAGAQQDYPNRPLRMIVPWPPGQATDLVGRVMAQKMSDVLGQQIVIDNRAGAGGMIGTDVGEAVPGRLHAARSIRAGRYRSIHFCRRRLTTRSASSRRSPTSAWRRFCLILRAFVPGAEREGIRRACLKRILASPRSPRPAPAQPRT